VTGRIEGRIREGKDLVSLLTDTFLNGAETLIKHVESADGDGDEAE